VRRLAFSIALLTPSFAWAQADNSVARAQVLFEQAVVEARGGNYASACPKFAASQRLDPKASTLLNLASCYELNGQSASAWASFKEAEASARKHGRTDWAERAAAAVKKIEPTLVRLTVHVPQELRALQLRVELDGSPLQGTEWEQALPIDPGAHRVDWTAPEYKSAMRSVTVGTSSIDVTLTALERVPAPVALPTTAATSSTRDTLPVGFWTTGRVVGAAIGGVGIAGMIAGTVFGLSASSKYDEAEALCGDTGGSPRMCLPERSSAALAARDSAGSRATASTVFFVAGGALTAGGAALFLLSRPGSTRQMALVPWNAGVAAVGRW
jgi:hypothetical protein